MLVDLNLAVELDLPQLLGKPPRKVTRATRVNPAPALIGPGAGAHPHTRLGPREVAERTDATCAQKLVRDHLPPLHFARSADHQRLGRLRRARFAERPEHIDRRLHLFQIGDAPVAHHQVLLDMAERSGGERSLEIVGDELDELLARDLVSSHAEVAGREAIPPRA